MITKIISPLVITVVIASAIAQVLKLLVYYFLENRWEWTRLLETGGMPSSHSATATALAVGVGLQEGFNSTYFAIAFVLAIIIMYDATGIRREAGFHAKQLNELMRELHEIKTIGLKPKPLKELLGHTYLEVGVGAFLGGVVAWVCYWLL